MRRAETAATVAREAARVASAKTTGVPATAAVTASAMLGPHGHCENERERRDGYQAAHTEAIIPPKSKPGAGSSDSARMAGKKGGGLSNQTLPCEHLEQYAAPV